MIEYTGWMRPLIVTLTATSNPYLKDRLPLRGNLKVVEMRLDGYAQPTKMLFQEVTEGGSIKPYVSVDHAEFTYTGPAKS